MRVLFITHRFPGAAHRGDQVRALAQIQAMSKHHELHVLCFERPPAGDPAWARLQPFCASLSTVPRAPVRMLMQAGLALLRSRPLQTAMFDSSVLNAAVQALIRQHRIELVQVQLVRLAGVIEQLDAMPVVLDYVDALSRNMAARAALETWPRRWLFGLEARRLLRLERALLNRVSGAVICSPVDADEIAGSERLQIAANGVDLAAFDACPEPAERQGLVFVGNWAYFPNQQGLRWLLDTVMPRVWRQFPALTLTLAGANPGAIPKHAHRDGVRILGSVDSVVPVLKQSAVAIAPLQAGSGQSLKILEAMAAATPVVATARAAAALTAESGQDLLVAGNAAEFADAICQLLGSPERRQQVGLAGQAYVRAHYDWDHSHAVLDGVWQAAVQASAAMSPGP